MTRKMKLSPILEVAANAEQRMNQGWTVYQQWNCAHCGVKQTMPDENVFYTAGKCEECGGTTDIAKDGCNFMATKGATPSTLDDVLKETGLEGD